MKRIVSVLAALLLLFALCVPTLAANTYSLDLSDVSITGSTADGIGKVLVTGDEETGRMYARIVLSYQRSDGTTWLQTMVLDVDLDNEFVMPYNMGLTDTLTSVGVVILTKKDASPSWAGYNLTAPAVVS